MNISSAFPTVVHSERFLTENVARDICAQVSRHVVSVVPRLDDYICPVCLSIAWLPVRLDCAHVFCVRCVMKMQQENQRFCPLCRGEVVMQADLGTWFLSPVLGNEYMEERADQLTLIRARQPRRKARKVSQDILP